MHHALAFFGGVAQTSLGKVYSPALPLNAFWKAAQSLAGVSEIVSYDAYVFIDIGYIFHFRILRFKSYKRETILTF